MQDQVVLGLVQPPAEFPQRDLHDLGQLQNLLPRDAIKVGDLPFRQHAQLAMKSRREGAEDQKAGVLEHDAAAPTPLFLPQDVLKHRTLLALIVIACSDELGFDPVRRHRGGNQLVMRVAERGASLTPHIIKRQDVAKSHVPLQVEHPFLDGSQRQRNICGRLVLNGLVVFLAE
mgnify:CR=1 FL=1